MDLKVQLLQEKEKLKAKAQGVSVASKKKTDSFKVGNKGVEQRNLRDLQNEPEGNLQQNLEAKAKAYDQLIQDKKSHKKGKKFLVDFEQKRWDMQEKYEEACQDYKGSQQVTEMEKEKVGVSLNSEMGSRLRKQEEERKKWEDGVKKGEIKETQEITIRKVPLVKQSYDHILSKEEKAHLPEIEAERQRHRQEICNLLSKLLAMPSIKRRYNAQEHLHYKIDTT